MSSPPTTNEIVEALKKACESNASDGAPRRPAASPRSPDDWFAYSGEPVKLIPYEVLAEKADEEYYAWRRLPEEMDASRSFGEQLRDWIRKISTEALQARIDETLPNIDETRCFTPWQRFLQAYFIAPPFDRFVELSLNLTSMWEMLNCDEERGRKKRVALHTQDALHKGSPPEVTIVDTPTGTGKTACAIAMAMLLLCPVPRKGQTASRFDELGKAARGRRKGVIIEGVPNPKIARLCIIVAGGTTQDHFRKTLAGMITVAEKKYPGYEIVAWHGMNKDHSVKNAYNVAGDKTAVFWCIGAKAINSVLRIQPGEANEYIVACCITDEMIHPPRERQKTCKSPILHHIITQATPQALEDATAGSQSWLKEKFKGQLIPPCKIKDLIVHRQFKEAQTAMDQACALELMTVTPFRDYIRKDLARLIPNGMKVYFVHSRVLTVTAFLVRSTVDMVPANFSNVLLSMLRKELALETDSICAINGISHRQHSLEDLITIIRGLRSADHPAVQRIIDRLEDLSVQCPICLSDDPCFSNQVMIYGCCGYCVCKTCFTKLTCCPFCRSSVPSELPRNTVPQAATKDQQATPLPFSPASSLDDDISSFTSETLAQSQNLLNTLRILKHHGHKRILIVVERMQYATSAVRNFFDSTGLGLKIHVVNDTFNGQGTKFAKIKAEFDDPTTGPMALLCFGDGSFLYGTDLGHTDAVVAVGAIPATYLTQAIGRVMRPSTRGNNNPIPLVKIECRHNRNRPP